MLQAMVIAVSPEKKERTINGDRCNSAKDPLMVKSVFSLEYKGGNIVSGDTYLG